MASLNDIDTDASVRKYLERSAVSDREDVSVNSADEITAILEACALSFLLYPQVSLNFILRAKNGLQQIIDSDLSLLDFMLAAINDVQNPNEPINNTSDLVEAQTALVEVDRIGRISSEVRAYDRYVSAVNRFLDNQLATSLKRRKLQQFERSGSEAKQDLFRALSTYTLVHAVMAQRLSILGRSTSNFESVDLTQIIASQTVTSVRSSLSQIVFGINQGSISKTTVAIELLAGAAALQSISNGRHMFDPLVDTGNFPEGRTITAYSGPIAATATGTASVVNLGVTSIPTPWNFTFVVDPLGANISYSAVLPLQVYISANRPDNSLPFVIPSSNRTLFIQMDGPTPPDGQQCYVVTVALTAGSRTATQVASDINAAVQPYASCTNWNGTGRILIQANSSLVTRIVVRSSYMGTFAVDYTYIYPDGSIHDVVGFTQNQTSESYRTYSPAALLDIVDVYSNGVDGVLDDTGAASITSQSTAITSSLRFTGAVASAFGFSGTAIAEPTYITLRENGVDIDPTSLDITIGSIVEVIDVLDTFRSLRGPIVGIDGVKLFFETQTIPRASGQSVEVASPLVDTIQTLMSALRPYVGTFFNDSVDLQRVLTPLLSTPTFAQIGDAISALSDLRTRVQNLRSAIETLVVNESVNQFLTVSNGIVASLEERGLDRALDLLLQANFSGFFSLTNETASKSSRLMKATETLVRSNIRPPSTVNDTPDVTPLGTTDDGLLNDTTLPSDENVI